MHSNAYAILSLLTSRVFVGLRSYSRRTEISRKTISKQISYKFKIVIVISKFKKTVLKILKLNTEYDGLKTTSDRSATARKLKTEYSKVSKVAFAFTRVRKDAKTELVSRKFRKKAAL